MVTRGAVRLWILLTRRVFVYVLCPDTEFGGKGSYGEMSVTDACLLAPPSTLPSYLPSQWFVGTGQIRKSDSRFVLFYGRNISKSGKSP